MSRRTAAWLVWSMLALTVLFDVFGCLLLVLNAHSPSVSTWYTLAVLPFTVVGVVIASHRPQNPIGWMFCVIGLAYSLLFFTHQYAVYALVTRPAVLPGGMWLAWSQYLMAFILWLLIFLSILLFPTGRLPSPRWRPLAWTLAGVLVLMTGFFAIKPGRLEGVRMRVPNPAGIERAAGIAELSINILAFMVLVIVVAIAASVIVRFRRATGEERQQLKWLTFAAGFLGSSLGLGLLTLEMLHNRVIEVAIVVLSFVAIAAVPTTVGVAILRYRLYDIDIVINRTLVYGSLTAALAVVYFGGVTATQAIFQSLTGQEQLPQLAIVASTLVIAALFTPLRRRIQSFIDKRFYRRKYDARKTLEAFSARLRDETDLDALNKELVGVVRETMQPAHVSLWLRPDPVSQGGDRATNEPSG